MNQHFPATTLGVDRLGPIHAAMSAGDQAAQMREKCLLIAAHGEGGMTRHSLNNLREVAQYCQTGEPLPTPLAFWLATSLETFLDQYCDSLNEAFGLQNKHGGLSWRLAASIRARDEALCSLAIRHFPKRAVSSQAANIHRLSTRYAASSWRFDRESEVLCEAYRDTPREYLWQAFKSGAAMPVSTRRLQTILVQRRGTAAA